MTTIPQDNFTNIPHIVFQVFYVHSYLVTFVNFGFSLNFSEEQDEVITSFYFFMLSIQNYYSVLYFTALYVLWMKEYTQGFQDIVKWWGMVGGESLVGEIGPFPGGISYWAMGT